MKNELINRIDYYKIHEFDVYISTINEKELNEYLRSQKSALFVISSRILGFDGNPSKSMIEAHNLIKLYLENEYRSNKNEFYQKWVWFNLANTEAQKNIANLLYYFSKLNDGFSVSGNDEMVILEWENKRKRWQKRKIPKFSIILNYQDIKKISGDLRKMLIEFVSGNIVLEKNRIALSTKKAALENLNNIEY